ncbi:hypothetical protein [Vibrio anguillarum]|uniref:Uncharacterized protein n=2 Tax=Vibrio anguillarum TaxID=55601 RepID=A0ABR9Z8Q4_VIBAN|nr:hypothetical protein [Vibrio anguillarum]MBF4374481.1 hypothetical protein [Vibrio anguillarum]
MGKSSILPTSAFVNGTLNDFASHAALSFIETQSHTSSQVGKVPYMADLVFDELQARGNPIATIMTSDMFNYQNHINHYESGRPETMFDMARVIDIAGRSQCESGRFIANIQDSAPSHSYQAAEMYLTNAVRDQVVLRCSQVTLASCREMLSGTPLTKEMVYGHYKEHVTDALEASINKQQDIAVSMVALNNLKESALKNYDFVDFLKAHGASLDNTSAMNSDKLLRIKLDCDGQGIEIPTTFKTLVDASVDFSNRHPSLKDTDLPVGSQEIYAILGRENINFTSHDFTREVLIKDSELPLEHERFMESLAQNNPKTKSTEPQSLTELLNQNMDSPSM